MWHNILISLTQKLLLLLLLLLLLTTHHSEQSQLGLINLTQSVHQFLPLQVASAPTPPEHPPCTCFDNNHSNFPFLIDQPFNAMGEASNICWFSQQVLSTFPSKVTNYSCLGWTHLNKLAKARKMRKPPGTLGLKRFWPGNIWIENVWTQNSWPKISL